MVQKEAIVAVLLGLIVVGGTVTTFVVLDGDENSIDTEDEKQHDNSGEDVLATVDTVPRISAWNVTHVWDGEKPTVFGVAFDEDLANVTVNMVVFDQNMTQITSPISFSVNPDDGTWNSDIPLSQPGNWIVLVAAMDATGQSSNASSIHVITVAPDETVVEIMFLWTQPIENSSIGSLSGILVHEFPETCSINYSPGGQMPITSPVNNSTGEYNFEIDVETTNLSGNIVADCGLFINFDPVSVSVLLPIDEDSGDEDSDGITDESDNCPLTPLNEPVYSDGCSDSQLDEDSDGVNDSIDECPNTPSGEIVDGVGCSDSQKDDDGDGVNNTLDSCPNTPIGEVVDQVGCSDSQKDSDGDGVSDDLDQCPNTSAGSNVGADGCTLPDWNPEDSWVCTDGQGPWVKDYNQEEGYSANNNGVSAANGGGSGPWFQCEVSVTIQNGKMVVDSNGIPNHDFLSTRGCCAPERDYTSYITLNPVNDTAGGHSSTDCPASAGRWECVPDRGAVAVAVNGVPMYGPEEGPGGDAVALHFNYFDEDRQPIELGWCTGHSAGSNGFHYHYDANCIYWEPSAGEDMSDYDMSKIPDDQHSPIIGWAFDGYPIYGMYGYGDDGASIRAITSSYTISESDPQGPGYNGIDDWSYGEGVGDLDECNGRFGPTPEYPEGIYHYVSTPLSGSPTIVTDANNNPVAMIGFPYFILCYHGIADVDGQSLGGGQGGGPPGPPIMHASGELYSFTPPKYSENNEILPDMYIAQIIDFMILIVVIVGITVVTRPTKSQYKVEDSPKH